MTSILSDIDGVIALHKAQSRNNDFPIEQYRRLARNATFNKEFYEKHLADAEELNLVTCRPSNFRDLTENWLESNPVKFKELRMMDYREDLSLSLSDLITFKEKVIISLQPDIYFDDDEDIINALIGKDLRTMIYEVREGNKVV